jgi:hypothetical protein
VFEGFAREFGEAAGGGEDGVARGVVDGEAQVQTSAGGSGGLGGGDGADERRIQRPLPSMMIPACRVLFVVK